MKKVTLLLIAMLGLAGCPGNDKGSNTNGTVGLVGQCVGCGFNAAVFTQSVSSEIPQGILTLNLAGDANQMNTWARSGLNPLFSYQGPLSVSGTLVLNTALPFGMCQLPAGQYSVRTVQAGLYSNGVFQVPSLEIIGPSRIIVALTDGAVLTNGNGVISGFGAMLYGQQGPAVMMGGWGYNGGYTMSNCMDSVGVRF